MLYANIYSKSVERTSISSDWQTLVADLIWKSVTRVVWESDA